MSLAPLDIAAFVAFLAMVVGISLWHSRHEEDSADYFLAGRGLGGLLIGISLIASNISTEHFVGMAGSGYGAAGLAIASYEWIAAVTLVVVAFGLLPLFLRLGIYTMPEFLEHRFGVGPRTLMAVYMLVAYVGVAMAAVLYSGALGMKTLFGLDLITGIWLVGALAGVYTVYGGLKAVVWSDLIQGLALLMGGALVLFLGMRAVGGWDAFVAGGGDKLHVILPSDHPEIPWTALLLGIWIPNFFYWGFNQFITQRTLGASSLAAGQRGIVLAAFLKLLIPFLIVFPGIMAWQIYGEALQNGDQAYALLIRDLVPAGLRGILFAALFGAVMSSLDSMLNSASTIFTMDIYRRHVHPEADGPALLRVGRWTTGVLVVLACLLAPLPGRFQGVFTYIQMIWGFISPGVVAAFLFGVTVRRAPTAAAWAGLTLGAPIYGFLLWQWPHVAFLNHMALTFVLLVAVMGVVTLLRPRAEPATFPGTGAVDLTPSRGAAWAGGAVVAATGALYWVFR
ncbi:MAG TPA: solute:sodium symporter family transporter [Longimicrobiales bacterium]|nr:solute:sodium symporter family transporter [Longimicrobiales bacterium]